MHLVLSIPAGRRRHNGLILAILLLLPMCSLAQSKRADGEVHQNDPALSGMHGSNISPEAMPTRRGDRHVGVQSRPKQNRAGRDNPVSPATHHGWWFGIAGTAYLAQDKGYQISPVLGYRFGERYQAGVGAAVDQYSFRTLPVFCHFTVDLNLHKTTPFLYVDPGITFPWLRSREWLYGEKPDRNLPGTYFNMGIGQRLWLGKGSESLELSCGYSRESFRLVNHQAIMWVNPYAPSEPLWETYRYVFNRIALRLGLTF